MALRKYYGIKFPFTCNNDDGYFIDLNETIEDKAASEILHVLLTPIKTRIRMPDFGTGIVKYIFEPNDGESWERIKSEAINAVAKYVRNVSLNDVNIITDEKNENSVFLHLKYTVRKGETTEENELGIKLI